MNIDNRKFNIFLKYEGVYGIGKRLLSNCSKISQFDTPNYIIYLWLFQLMHEIRIFESSIDHAE